jgi:hypothetical protein
VTACCWQGLHLRPCTAWGARCCRLHRRERTNGSGVGRCAVRRMQAHPKAAPACAAVQMHPATQRTCIVGVGQPNREHHEPNERHARRRHRGQLWRGVRRGEQGTHNGVSREGGVVGGGVLPGAYISICGTSRCCRCRCLHAWTEKTHR